MVFLHVTLMWLCKGMEGGALEPGISLIISVMFTVSHMATSPHPTHIPEITAGPMHKVRYKCKIFILFR